MDDDQVEVMKASKRPDPAKTTIQAAAPSPNSVRRTVFCVNCTHHRTIPPIHYCKAGPPNLVTGDKEEWSAQ
jgi:hypothetical protein